MRMTYSDQGHILYWISHSSLLLPIQIAKRNSVSLRRVEWKYIIGPILDCHGRRVLFSL